MKQAGIRRVFWTNVEGEWEGGKVRDLADALDVLEDNEEVDNKEKRVSNQAPGRSSMFVTKHEVLMLRRLMLSSS